MLCSSLPGHDCWQLGISPLAMAFWYGTMHPMSRWKDTFLNAMPTWCMVTDMSALRDFFFGHTTFYRWHIFFAWLPSIAWWTAFALALGAVYVGLIALFRRQWIEHEKLAYPLVQIPLALAQRERQKC